MAEPLDLPARIQSQAAMGQWLVAVAKKPEPLQAAHIEKVLSSYAVQGFEKKLEPKHTAAINERIANIRKLAAKEKPTEADQRAYWHATFEFLSEYSADASQKAEMALMRDLVQPDPTKRAAALAKDQGKNPAIKQIADMFAAKAPPVVAAATPAPAAAPAPTLTPDAAAAEKAAEKARKEAEAKAAALKKEQAKAKLDGAKEKVKAAKEAHVKNPTQATQAALDAAEADFAALKKEAGEDNWFMNLWEKIKDTFSNVNPGSVVGGGLLAWLGSSFLGGLFGDSGFGAILKYALMIPLAIFGARFGGDIYNGLFGDKSNDGKTGDAQSRQRGVAPERLITLSPELLTQYAARARDDKSNGMLRTDLYQLAPRDGKLAVHFLKMGEPLPQYGLVTPEVLAQLSARSNGVVLFDDAVNQSAAYVSQVRAQSQQRSSAPAATPAPQAAAPAPTPAATESKGWMNAVGQYFADQKAKLSVTPVETGYMPAGEAPGWTPGAAAPAPARISLTR